MAAHAEGAAKPPEVQALDAELAARAQAALEAEDESAPAPVAPASPSAKEKPEPLPAVAPVQAAPAVAAPPKTAEPVAEPKPAPTVRARALVVEQGERLAAAYLRLGDGARKVIAWSAWGTLVQAIIVWAWVLFLRSAELPAAAPEEAPAAHAAAEQEAGGHH